MANASLDYALDELSRLVAGTDRTQLTNPTPCEKWTVHDLLNHVLGGGHLFAAAFRGEAVDMEGEPPDLVGDDAMAGWNAARADFDAAIAQPGALERDVVLPFATLPGQVAASVAFADLMIHCWDLATSTGQRFAPPDEIVAEADAVARMIISDEGRSPESFDAEVTTGPAATPLERLVAFAGRQP
jgi:uncharacterized protein (TIGR03086 family)